MRFFTDQYFSDEQKARVRTSQPLSLQMPAKPLVQQCSEGHCPSGYYSDEHVVIHGEAEIEEFVQTSKRIELIFLGSIVSVILAAALLDFISRSHALAV